MVRNHTDVTVVSLEVMVLEQTKLITYYWIIEEMDITLSVTGFRCFNPVFP